MSKKTIQDMFLTAKEKAANDFSLGKEMIDAVIGMLRPSPKRIRRINENWHLHNGQWPELDEYLGADLPVFKEEDREGEPLNWNDFIVHHPKLNNVTNYILGGIIMQPIIPIVRDFSSHGRKYREQARLDKLLSIYRDSVYAPQAELIRAQYFEEIGNPDPMSLNPDEQRQVMSELQQRIKSQMPRSIIDDLKKINTPDEKIRQVLLEYDIKELNIEEKFILGGEQAVVAYEEYYRIGKKGLKPTFESLNSKWVDWSAAANVDYVEDGDMATYRQYLTPHAFIMKYGREVVKKKNFMKDIEKYFMEVPGYFKEGDKGKGFYDQRPDFIDAERDFVDMIGENPGLIQNNWRTIAGQQEIAGLYGSLSSFSKPGWGIPEIYTTFKWSETITYVQRREEGKINEYLFSAEYEPNKSKDIMVRKFPINRVYHGSKIADRFYVGLGPVEWQFLGGIDDYEPKLTICGRKYARSNGNDEDTTLMGPAIQYQLRYDITASKMEDLEKSDIGKITFWNTEVKPESWSEREYMEGMIKGRNVPYTPKAGGGKDADPVVVVDAGSTAKLEEYRRSLDMWENEMYKAMRVNRDAIGQANPYQSNAQTQSNIEGASKQLLPFHNKRRLLKQRVLNYISNLSVLCLIDDHEKQAILFDDFSRLHLQVNAEEIKAHKTAIFIVDDYAEAQNVERIKARILEMFQQGTSLIDIIDIMDSKSVPVMREIAQIAEIKMKDEAADAHEKRMAEINASNEAMRKQQELIELRKDIREEKKNQKDLILGEMESMTMENAADVDENKIADSITRAAMDNASKEKIAREKNETDLEKERIKAAVKAKQGKLSKA